MLEPTIFLMFFKIISSELTEIRDLTWDFSNETIFWPGVTPFSFTKIVGNEEERGYWYALNEFTTAEHVGTHLDAPYHFFKQGWKVDEIPIERLIGKGATIDLTKNSSKFLEPHHLNQWIQTNGQFQNNTILLIKFGWSQFWNNKTKYLGLNHGGKLNFPGISADAANWIANSGKIVGVGLDTPSVDPGTSSDFKAHRIMSKKQIFFMENVKILQDLPAKDFTVVALPMKIKNGTGAPLRLVVVPKRLSLISQQLSNTFNTK